MNAPETTAAPRPRPRPRVADPDRPPADETGRRRRPTGRRAPRRSRRAASRWPAPTSPSCRSTRSRPNPVQPRQVFDEEAMAELVHSIREVGLLQPVVVRPPGDDATTSWSWASGAGAPPRRPAWTRSRRSSARPTTTTCCATRCWRTCTAPSSTRWRRRPPTRSCSRTSAAPTRSSRRGSVAPVRRSATRCGCSSSRRPSSAGSPPACCRPATPGRCSPSRTPTLQDRLAQRVVAEGISVRGLEEIVAVGDAGAAARTARRGASRSRPAWPTSPTGSRTASRPGSRSTSGQRKGKITVEFASLDDLQRIVDVMDPRNRDDRPI